MSKKGLTWIQDAFEDRRRVNVIGLLCLIYFILHFIPGALPVARILPPWPNWILGIFGAAVLVYQVFAWKTYNLFQTGWQRHASVWGLLLSEFCLLTFAAAFLSWPFFWIWAALAEK